MSGGAGVGLGVVVSGSCESDVGDGVVVAAAASEERVR